MLIPWRVITFRQTKRAGRKMGAPERVDVLSSWRLWFSIAMLDCQGVDALWFLLCSFVCDTVIPDTEARPPSSSPCGHIFVGMYFLLSVFVASSESISNLLWNEINQVVIMFNASQYQFVIFFAKAPFQPIPIGIQSWEWFHDTY